jgi:glycerol-3-phosphate dehydrogenase (NAD+)
MDLSPSLPLSS